MDKDTLVTGPFERKPSQLTAATPPNPGSCFVSFLPFGITYFYLFGFLGAFHIYQRLEEARNKQAWLLWRSLRVCRHYKRLRRDIWPSSPFVGLESLIYFTTQPHPFFYILFVTVLAPQWQSWVVESLLLSGSFWVAYPWFKTVVLKLYLPFLGVLKTECCDQG